MLIKLLLPTLKLQSRGQAEKRAFYATGFEKRTPKPAIRGFLYCAFVPFG
jgi:hypothetical protein